MSKEMVDKFWKRIDEDEKMRKLFMEAVPQRIESGAPIVEFAAKHGFKFTEKELKAVAAVVGEKSALEKKSIYSYPAGSTSSRVLSSFATLRPGGGVAL